MRVITQINPGHKEIYDDLFNTPARERADRLRFLAMLGSLVLKGQLVVHGTPPQTVVEAPVARPDSQMAREKALLQSRMTKRLVAGLRDQ